MKLFIIIAIYRKVKKEYSRWIAEIKKGIAAGLRWEELQDKIKKKRVKKEIKIDTNKILIALIAYGLGMATMALIIGGTK